MMTVDQLYRDAKEKAAGYAIVRAALIEKFRLNQKELEADPENFNLMDRYSQIKGEIDWIRKRIESEEMLASLIERYLL